MAETTEISWADSTFNAWIGCEAISPACANCYAAAWAKRYGRDFSERTRTKDWTAPHRWERDHAAFHAEHGRRRRVFSDSLGDWLDKVVPIEWLADHLDLIRTTPNLDWLLLTKRVGNWSRRLDAARDFAFLAGRTELHDWIAEWRDGRAPSNVWLGITVVNQEEADRDIPKLLAIPAAIRFVSMEPLLGLVDLRKDLGGTLWIGGQRGCAGKTRGVHHHDNRCGRGLDWVIVGAESDRGARPAHPLWLRSLRDQCVHAGVPLLVKQWGEWLPIDQQSEAFTSSLYKSRVKARPSQDQANLDDLYGRDCTVESAVIHHDGSVHDVLEPMAFLQGTGAMTTFKVGKKRSGRLLDGVLHNAFPEVAA